MITCTDLPKGTSDEFRCAVNGRSLSGVDDVGPQRDRILEPEVHLRVSGKTIVHDAPKTSDASAVKPVDADDAWSISSERETDLREAAESGEPSALYTVLSTIGCLPHAENVCAKPYYSNAGVERKGEGQSGSGGTGGSSDVVRDFEDEEILAAGAAAAAKVPADLVAAAWETLRSWRQGLKVGDSVDVFVSLEDKWYPAKIVPSRQQESAGKKKARAGSGSGSGSG
ncbi:unnamed protein product, partial [Discosporangium mesarthrocarpum]